MKKHHGFVLEKHSNYGVFFRNYFLSQVVRKYFKKWLCVIFAGLAEKARSI